MMVSRRALIGGAATFALIPPARGAARELAAALDAAAAERDPARALRLLGGFDAHRLAGSARLDLLTARGGLATDAAIIARFGVDPRDKVVIGGNRALYDLLLQRKLGPHPGVEAIDARLAAEQQRVTAAAMRLFDGLGGGAGAVGERYIRLWNDPAQRYPDSEAGRDRAVSDMNRTLAHLRGLVPALTGAIPGYCLDVSASQGSVADQAVGKVGVRTLPTPDRPGAYVVDLARLHDRPRWTLPSVVAHELLPGHMIQMPMEVAARPHKLRLDYAPAFPEGWGIHAERMVAEAGTWAGDPHAQLGYLHWRLFRLTRARVDIGLHCLGWSVDTARRRLVEWQGEPAYFAPFERDLPRIMADPATRAAEMLVALALGGRTDRAGGGRALRFAQAMLVDGRMRIDEINARLAQTGW